MSILLLLCVHYFQCELNPRIPYTHFSSIIKKQKQVHIETGVPYFLIQPLQLFGGLYRIIENSL